MLLRQHGVQHRLCAADVLGALVRELDYEVVQRLVAGEHDVCRYALETSMPYVDGHVDAVAAYVLYIGVFRDGLEWTIADEVPDDVVEDLVPFLDLVLAEAPVVPLGDYFGLLEDVVPWVDVLALGRLELLAEYSHDPLIGVELFLCELNFVHEIVVALA